ncbi:MAG: disulfide bond formation protein B [Sphingomonadales bacterium]
MSDLFNFINKLSQTPLSFLFLSSFLTLGTAYVFQYGFDYFPCQMCYWQRYPYMAVIILGMIGLLNERGIYTLSKSFPKLILQISTLLLLIDGGIAGFHVGVEYNWWEGLTACTSPVDMSGSIEEVLEQIKNAPLVRCDTAAWTMFGVSMAGYNFFVAMMLASFGLFSLKKKVN